MIIEKQMLASWMNKPLTLYVFHKIRELEIHGIRILKIENTNESENNA